MAKAFVGMVFPDTHPITVPDRDVKRVHMFDIPTPLRQYAQEALDYWSGDQWWTVGEFRYAGEDYGTAVARRVRRDGRVVLEYGIER